MARCNWKNNGSTGFIIALTLLRVAMALPVQPPDTNRIVLSTHGDPPKPPAPPRIILHPYKNLDTESQSDKLAMESPSTTNDPSLDYFYTDSGEYDLYSPNNKAFCFNTSPPGIPSEFDAGDSCKDCGCQNGLFICNKPRYIDGVNYEITKECRQRGRCRCITTEVHREINKSAFQSFSEHSEAPCRAKNPSMQNEFENENVAFCFEAEHPKPGHWGSKCGNCNCKKGELECEDPATFKECKWSGLCKCITATKWRAINSAALDC